MPVIINEVETEVQAVDASALLSPEVIEILAQKVVERLAQDQDRSTEREADAEVTSGRRAGD